MSETANDPEGEPIGGARREDQTDGPEQAVEEGGGGVAEGFEEAEEELREQAEHGEPGRSPYRRPGEPEPDRAEDAHGEADHVESSETESDGG